VSKILPSAWTSNPAIIEHIADEAADLVCKCGRVGVGAREGVCVYKLLRKYAFMNTCDLQISVFICICIHISGSATDLVWVCVCLVCVSACSCKLLCVCVDSIYYTYSSTHIFVSLFSQKHLYLYLHICKYIDIQTNSFPADNI